VYFLAPRRADIAGDDLADMDADPIRSGQEVACSTVHSLPAFRARRRRPAARHRSIRAAHRTARGSRRQELVHDAAVAVENLDQHGKAPSSLSTTSCGERVRAPLR